MCGVCGFVSFEGPDHDAAPVRAMSATLVHRGPDGGGEAPLRTGAGEPAGWFGHRRLRIIDLTDAAEQPMRSDDGSVLLTFNGEVYNFRELRSELERQGHRFRSTGDTEVVLRSYEAWGERFVERIDGMFAIALWDARRDRLLLARDRTGKKPLFYAAARGRLTFGSEIKAVLAAPWVDPRPDLSRVPEYLTYGYVPGPGTFYEGIVEVPPASVVTFGPRGPAAPRRFWDAPPQPGAEPPASEVDAEVARLLRAAVRRRLVSDVPLGALLSGGLDSSLVVALMTEAAGERVRTFSAGFPDEPSYDERRYARLVAERFGTDHTEFTVEADAAALMDELLWLHDGPYGDSSAIPTYLVSKLAREHVTVALNGDGGDEVFGGYERFAAAAVADRVPAPAGRAALAAAALLPRSDGYHGTRRRVERFFAHAGAPVEHRYRGWISIVSPELLAELAGPAAAAGVGRSLDEAVSAAGGAPALDRILYANFRTYLPHDLAVKMDRTSMAHSLEARSPFLDTALIEFLARVPARRKVGLRRVKPLLRRAFGPLLPEEIWRRRKHGFGVPMDRWFRGPLAEPLRDEVLAPDARTRELLDPAALGRMWRAHEERTANHGQALWTVLNLERWLRSLEGGGAPTRPAIAAVSA